MMFLGCDIPVEKQLWVQGLNFLGDEKLESDIIVVILPQDSVVPLPFQG